MLKEGYVSTTVISSKWNADMVASIPFLSTNLCSGEVHATK